MTLRRSSFKRPVYVAPAPAPLRRVERSGVIARCSDVLVAVPKEQVLESAAYENLVRAMPCAHCGWPPRSQFCHADLGKGLGIKTDVRRGWPGCGPHNHEPGCHWLLGSSGRIPREQRRELEARYGAQTRAAILAAGTWPKSLPLFTEQPDGTQ